MAGMIGIAMVILVMVSYYRLAGVLAVSALSLYVLYMLGTLAGMNAVLTFPGIAGMILSIGMAVDANVLIFERIREELALGRSVRPAVARASRTRSRPSSTRTSPPCSRPASCSTWAPGRSRASPSPWASAS
jgi:protein-export membrane protein SecD